MYIFLFSGSNFPGVRSFDPDLKVMVEICIARLKV